MPTTWCSGAIRPASSAWCSCSKAPASPWRCTAPTDPGAAGSARHGLFLPALARHAGPGAHPHLAELLEPMTPEDQAEVLHVRPVFYKLYGDIFRALPRRRRDGMQLNNARILLTGATGGLGQALARQLGRRRGATCCWPDATRQTGRPRPLAPTPLSVRRSDRPKASPRCAARARFRHQRADQQCRHRLFGLFERAGLARHRAGHGDQSAAPMQLTMPCCPG
jgi:hypothetical protein